MSSSSARVPARVSWAAELLDVQPGDEILEVGCGPGVAVALICERLDGGRITAIDRSAVAVERTRERNHDHERSRRLALEQVDLTSFRGEPDQFGKAFAVNVNIFWTGNADAECAVLAAVLRAGGVLHLVYGGRPGSDEDGSRDVGSRIAGNLERHGFVTEIVHGRGGDMFCVTGHVPRQD